MTISVYNLVLSSAFFWFWLFQKLLNDQTSNAYSYGQTTFFRFEWKKGVGRITYRDRLLLGRETAAVA